MADEDPPDADAEVVDAPEPEQLHGIPVTWSRGQRVLHPTREQLVELVRTLRDEDWVMCIDVTGVDYLGYKPSRHLPAGIEAQRFEVVVLLISHTERARVRLRVQVPE